MHPFGNDPYLYVPFERAARLRRDADEFRLATRARRRRPRRTLRLRRDPPTT